MSRQSAPGFKGGIRNRICDDLFNRAVKADDLYVALAIHPFVDPAGRSRLERVLFATGKRRRQVVSARYTPASVLARMANSLPEKAFRLRLARHPATVPETLVELIAGDTSEVVTAAVAAHTGAPADLLGRIDWRGSAAVQMALCGNPNTPRATLREVVSGASLDCLKLAAGHPQADADMLRRLWTCGDRFLRAEVVANRLCPEDLQEVAEACDDALVRRKLASNPASRSGALRRLLEDPAPQVRAAAAGNPGLPAECAAVLVNDPARQVRRATARRAGLPEEALVQLSRDDDSWVRRWVARNRTTPTHLLRRLATNDSTEIRRAVARNAGCPVELLRRLACDSDGWVRAGVAFRHDLPEQIVLDLAGDGNADVLSGIGSNPATPGSVLMKIAEHRDKDIRRAVILNRQAPRRVLRILLEDPYPLNRALLAKHGALGASDCYVLIDDPEPQVRFAAACALAQSARDAAIRGDNESKAIQGSSTL